VLVGIGDCELVVGAGALLHAGEDVFLNGFGLGQIELLQPLEFVQLVQQSRAEFVRHRPCAHLDFEAAAV